MKKISPRIALVLTALATLMATGAAQKTIW